MCVFLGDISEPHKNHMLIVMFSEWNRRIELIQDFEFPTVPTKLKVSKDGHYIVATGIYKPQVRVFDLNQLSMKFDRHMDSEPIQFQVRSYLLRRNDVYSSIF
jgi:ribosome biogenesis protein ENP2